MKNFNKKKIIIIIVTVLLILLSFSGYIFLINHNARKNDIYTEITFVSPRQAVIFWKSNKETVGYVKYGESKYKRDSKEMQTSSDPSFIHAVFLENIPFDGTYISLHTMDDNIFLIPKILRIQYEESEDINE